MSCTILQKTYWLEGGAQVIDDTIVSNLNITYDPVSSEKNKEPCYEVRLGTYPLPSIHYSRLAFMSSVLFRLSMVGNYVQITEIDTGDNQCTKYIDPVRRSCYNFCPYALNLQKAQEKVDKLRSSIPNLDIARSVYNDFGVLVFTKLSDKYCIYWLSPTEDTVEKIIEEEQTKLNVSFWQHRSKEGEKDIYIIGQKGISSKIVFNHRDAQDVVEVR